MDDSTEKFQVLKRDLVSRHNREMRHNEKVRSGGGIFMQTRMGVSDVKPSRPAVSLEQLLPIHCSSLAPDTVHSGRVLRGTLIVDPLVINAAHTIIEDEAGNVAEVAVYNFVRDGVDYLQRRHKATSLFSQGQKVAIIEPYYKLSQAGSLMVRIDDFSNDFVFLDHLGPRLSEDWKGEGKDHFVKQHFSEAIHCFRRSIDTHTESKLAAVLLSNIATSLMLKENLISSLLFAVASIVVDGSMFRPFYTAGYILNRLNRKDLAYNCVEQCERLKAPPRLCQNLVAVLGNNGKEHIAASKWNADILSIVAADDVQELLRINSGAPINCLRLKEEGNELFRNGKYDESIREYCMALRGITDVDILLNNRAVCYARLGYHAEAALHVSAAILITPSLVKAHYWKAMLLFQLNRKQEAQACCETGLNVVGGNGDLERLRERIGCSLEEPGGQDHPCMQQNPTAREQEERYREGRAPTSSVARFNEVLNFLNASAGNQSSRLRDLGLNVDNRVAPFHLEFSREGHWPALCDANSAMELLKRAYENARAPDLGQVKALMKDSIDLSESDTRDLCKRLNSISPSVLRWWYTAQLGSISPRIRNPYYSNIHSSFTNSPSRENVITFGTVHVSVGFVDLSELLFSRMASSEDHSGPLRWIGYEASAYSVGKTMVIAQMIRQEADTDEILQVWYSSTWTEKTLRAFRTALQKLIDSARGPNSIHFSEEVVMLWNHWQQFDIGLQTARSEWLSRKNVCNHVEIANFRRKLDRIALCRYLVSGDVLGGTVGSVVMFGLPKNKDGDRYEILSERFLHCLPIYKIFREIDSNTDVIAAAIRILQRRISELKKQVIAGNVEIDLRHKIVTPDHKNALLRIRRLSPHSMNWSNLCDYYSNEAFHNMARACSGDETIHYLYSMNWSTEVKGAHLMDYQESVHEEVLDIAKDAISKLYCFTGMTAYLHDPPITHSYNLALSGLTHAMHKAWTDNFFTAANLDDREKQVPVIEPALFDVLGRAPGAIYMVYTFSPALNFKPVNDS